MNGYAGNTIRGDNVMIHFVDGARAGFKSDNVDSISMGFINAKDNGNWHILTHNTGFTLFNPENITHIMFNKNS